MKIIYIKNKITISILIVALFVTTNVFAQKKQEVKSVNYLNFSWKKVATQMPEEWYGSDEAKLAAENVLLNQKEIGGWAKNKPYHHPLTEVEKSQIIKDKTGIGSTFDNGATITEMMFLSKVYAKIKDERYRNSFMQALEYILKAQYANGGWPQFFPFRKGKSVDYASHITYNDNAMVNVLMFLNDIVKENTIYTHMQINSLMKARAKKSFDKGIECILKTQIMVDGKPTVWCAQHDEFTFQPAKARSYELPSFSGSESVGITLLLMEIENPTREIISAVNGAVEWFEKNKIEGIRLVPVDQQEGKDDIIVTEDKTAPAVWARFYDLETGKPFFSDRDGIKKNTLAEIGYNRRSGYTWYTDKPQKVLESYPVWAKKYIIKN